MEISTKQRAIQIIDEQFPLLCEISQKIFTNPEIAWQEHFAVEVLTSYLETNNFNVRNNVAGIPTAFLASTHGTHIGKKLAIIAEYDALPGIGHGCGHNLIAAGAVGAAVGVAKSLLDFSGDLLVIGTPAEEYTDGKAGKIRLIEHGVFSDVDVCLMFHPWVETTIGLHDFGFISNEITFYGRPAHAAADPWNGQNALDAAVLTYNSISVLRQQLRPDCRVHCIITNGGQAVNVIPKEASLKLMMRSTDSQYLDEINKKLERCVKSAAEATGTTVEIRQLTHIQPIKINKSLAEIIRSNAVLLGVDVKETEMLFASSDFGNVSHLIPCLNIMMKTHEINTNWHSEVVANNSLKPLAMEGMLNAAKILAMSSIDILTNPILIGSNSKSEI